MKKILAVMAILFVCALAQAQSTIGASRGFGRFYAPNYNYGGASPSLGAGNPAGPSIPPLKVAIGNAATGTATITLQVGYITLPDARVVFPLCAGASSCGGATPIIVNPGGANQETVTPTAVSNCNLFPVNTTFPQCQVTATFSNTHAQGEFVASGTAGLQEAVNDAGLSTLGWNTVGTVAPASNYVTVDGVWGVEGGTITMLRAAVLGGFLPDVIVEDLRGPQARYWVWRPNAKGLIAAPSAPTLTVTTGSLSSGAYKGTAAYVDCAGGISLDSSESGATATTTGVIFTSPAAATGACGWIPRLSTAGGSGNEILAASPLTSAICTLSNLVRNIPVCAIGANATITAANPSSTAKPQAEGIAFSTFAAQEFSQLPAPVVTEFPFGVFVATATLNNSNADGAQIGPFPAQYFNQFGRSCKLEFKGATATQVASSVLQVSVTAANQYGQSPVNILQLSYPTQTQAAAGTQFGAMDFQVSTTGSSGKLWPSTPYGNWYQFANAAVGTQVVIPDATTAESSTIDLTKQIYLAVNLAETASHNITGPIINSLSLTCK